MAGKHVLCEKPITVSSQECKELCQLAKQYGVLPHGSDVDLFSPRDNHGQKLGGSGAYW